MPELNRSVIANIESGRRESVSVDQLLVLAAALHVSPALLFIPLGTAETFLVTPKLATTPQLALEWVIGGNSLEQPGAEGSLVLDWEPAPSWQQQVMPIRLFRRLRAAQDHLDHQGAALHWALNPSTAAPGVTREVDQARLAYDAALLELGERLEQISRAGLKAPPILTEQEIARLATLHADRSSSEGEG
jgi:transcriptional regulator with XRE-family HTH domain